MQRIGKVLRENLCLLPMAIFPYVSVLAFVSIPVSAMISAHTSDTIFPVVMTALGIFYLLYLLLCLADTVYCMRRKQSAASFAVQTTCLKFLQIPAYLFFFVVGVIGILMSVWGFWMTICAYLVDVLAIFMTGLLSLRSAIGLYRESRITKRAAVLCGIGGFLFCIDVVVAVYYAAVSGVDSAFLKKYITPVIKRFSSVV